MRCAACECTDERERCEEETDSALLEVDRPAAAAPPLRVPVSEIYS
jgi:hypothetical protein